MDLIIHAYECGTAHEAAAPETEREVAPESPSFEQAA